MLSICFCMCFTLFPPFIFLFFPPFQFFIYALCITGGYSQQHFFIRENLNAQQISVQQLDSTAYLLNSSFQQLQYLYRLALCEHSFSLWRKASIEREKTLREAALNPSALRKALSLSRTAQQLALSSTIFGSDLGEGDEEAYPISSSFSFHLLK